MTTEDANKQLLRDLLRAMDERRLERLPEFYHPDFCEPERAEGKSDHSGLAALQTGLAAFMRAFDDYAHTVEDLVAEGDRVAARITFSGVFARPLFGTPPSGQRVTATGIAIYRIVGGKIKEKWGYFDALALLGVTPSHPSK